MEGHRFSSFLIVVVAAVFSVDASENGQYLLVANSFHISRVSPNGSSFENLYSDPLSGRIVGLDYHYSEGYMYWSDDIHGTLNRALLNGSNDEILLHTDNPVIDGIAVDWVNEKLYWTEATVGEVLVMDIMQRQKRKLIVNHDGSRTRAITVDPATRYMYWSDWGDEARIERAGMDGSNRTILHNTDLIWPNGIAIDYENQILYWIDASLDTLEYSNVDGTGRTLLNQGGEIVCPFSITLNDDYLFWTDWQELAIFTTHKNQLNGAITSFYQLTLRPQGIEVVTPDRQRDAENPCDSADCDSSTLCLLSPNAEGFSCLCTDDDADCKRPTPLPPPLGMHTKSYQ
jgi:DNA-binding beta-propeller fold protein YncE